MWQMLTYSCNIHYNKVSIESTPDIYPTNVKSFNFVKHKLYVSHIIFVQVKQVFCQVLGTIKVKDVDVGMIWGYSLVI